MELFGLLAIALIGTIINGISTWATNEQNSQNANEQLAKQQQFSHNEAELANQRMLDNYWSTQSPEARVKQIKDAGLSVGLMYGGNAAGGGVNAGTQAQTPAANLPIMQKPFAGGLNDLFENVKKMTETESIGAGTEKTKQEIDNLKNQIQVNNATIEQIATQNNLTHVLTANAQLDGVLRQIEVEVQSNTKDSRIKIVSQQLENLQREAEKMLKEIEGQEIDNENKQKMYDATVAKMSAETTLLYHQIVKVDAETMMTKTMTALTSEQTQLSNAQKQKVYKDIEQYQAINAKIEAETKLLDQQTGKTKLEKTSVIIGWIKDLSQISSNITSTVGKAMILK